MIPVGGLFLGIGGIELGLERTGYFKTKWAVENDEFCRSIIRKHWPDIPIYGDIREIDWHAMPQVDMLTGGFPCQDISTANPRGEGIEGSRSGLWREYAKAIGVLRPKYALIENVPAIVRKGLDVVLADLAEAGYNVEWFDLRASDFGALHKRERIFIVAHTPNERRRQGENNREGGFIRSSEKRQFEKNQQTRDKREFGFDTDSRVVAHSDSLVFTKSRDDGEVREIRESALGEDTEHTVADPHENGLNGKGLPIFSGGSHQDNPRDKDGAAPDPDPIARHGILSRQPHHERRVVADDYRIKLAHFVQKKMQSEKGFSWCQNIRKVSDLRERPDIPESLFRGARDGVPDWVDRIKALGNAVVPDCAEFIGEMIMEFDKRVEVNP